jgi:hypothetical protein
VTRAASLVPLRALYVQQGVGTSVPLKLRPKVPGRRQPEQALGQSGGAPGRRSGAPSNEDCPHNSEPGSGIVRRRREAHRRTPHA